MEDSIKKQVLKERRNLVKHYHDISAGKGMPFRRVYDLAA